MSFGITAFFAFWGYTLYTKIVMKTYLEKCIGKKEKCSEHSKNDGLRCFWCGRQVAQREK